MAGDGQLTRQDVARARNDLGAFAELIGRPLQPFQRQALTLQTRHTALLAPRQTGESFSLAVLVSSAWRRSCARLASSCSSVTSGQSWRARSRYLRCLASLAARVMSCGLWRHA